MNVCTASRETNKLDEQSLYLIIWHHNEKNQMMGGKICNYDMQMMKWDDQHELEHTHSQSLGQFGGRWRNFKHHWEGLWSECTLTCSTMASSLPPSCVYITEALHEIHPCLIMQRAQRHPSCLLKLKIPPAQFIQLSDLWGSAEDDETQAVCSFFGDAWRKSYRLCISLSADASVGQSVGAQTVLLLIVLCHKCKSCQKY